MSTHILVHVEIKLDGKWEHYAAPDVEDKYDLFAKMAGIRAEGTGIVPIVAPKGLPEDITRVTRMDWQRSSDFHTPSWMNEEEIDALSEWLRVEGTRKKWEFDFLYLEIGVLHTYLFGCTLTEFISGSYDHLKEIEAVRLVFWFIG
jgi:hypothetical protein